MKSYPIVIIHLGGAAPPPYYEDCLYQLREFNDREIHIISPFLTESQQRTVATLKCIFHDVGKLAPSTLHENFKEIQTYNEDFREGFWRYVVERFFVLEEFMSKNGLDQCFYLEGDNLIYQDVHLPILNWQGDLPGILATFDHDMRAVPGVLYINDLSVLTHFCEHICMRLCVRDSRLPNDMELLGSFRHLHPDEIGELPVIPPSYQGEHKNTLGEISVDPCLFSHNFQRTQFIFDANALGQYFTGVDPRNSVGNYGRFVNETAMHNFTNYDLKWERRKPSLIDKLSGERFEIFNLHVHSKWLWRFRSRYNYSNDNILPPSTDLASMSEDEIITGERFAEIADIRICDRRTFRDYAHETYFTESDFLFIEEIEGNQAHLHLVLGAKIIFIHTHLLARFFTRILPAMHNRFVLISHLSDDEVGPELLSFADDDRLLHWYAQNLTQRHRKVSGIPIGLANRKFPHGDISLLHKRMCSPERRSRPMIFCESLVTHKQRAMKVDSMLRQGVEIHEPTHSFGDYISLTKQAFFVASPRGNGLDCHRTWEALYLGAVPVIDSKLDPSICKGLPIIHIENFNHIDVGNLIRLYRSGKPYTLQKLSLRYWKKAIIENIRTAHSNDEVVVRQPIDFALCYSNGPISDLIVALRSIIAANALDTIRIHVHTDLDPIKTDFIFQMSSVDFERNEFEILFHPLKSLDQIPEGLSFPKIFYYRLLLPLLHRSTKYIVYSDVDIIHGVAARDAICLTEEAGAFVSGVVDPMMECRQRLFGYEGIYLNSGFLVIDTQAWLSHDFASACFHWLVHNPQYHDQDAIFAICCQLGLNVHALPSKFNSLHPIASSVECLTGFNIHFAGPFKAKHQSSPLAYQALSDGFHPMEFGQHTDNAPAKGEMQYVYAANQHLAARNFKVSCYFFQMAIQDRWASRASDFTDFISAVGSFESFRKQFAFESAARCLSAAYDRLGIMATTPFAWQLPGAVSSTT